VRRRLLALTILAALTVPAAPLVAHAEEDLSVHSVSSELMCQCGCALTVAACQEAMECAVADGIVEEIDNQIAAGKTKGEVQGYFASVYGEKVLALPKKSGFSLTAWTTPFLAISAGAVALSVVVWWWVKARNSPPQEGPNPARPAAELSLYEQQVDRDLRLMGD
jgi:cytochrome c-type biogenesis protein CcmH